jgi:hypothetical protein
MPVTFPTRPTGMHAPGLPHRASHCRCVDQAGRRAPMLDPDTGRCTRCGHDTKDEIAEAWRDRAQRMAANRAKRAKAA